MSGEAHWERFVEEVPWDLDLLEDVRRVREGAVVEMLRRWGSWWLTLRSDHAELENWMVGDDAWHLRLGELDRLLRKRTKACSRCGEPCLSPMRTVEAIPGREWVPLCPACTRRTRRRPPAEGRRSVAAGPR
jgi:hypothetical protein